MVSRFFLVFNGLKRFLQIFRDFQKRTGFLIDVDEPGTTTGLQIKKYISHISHGCIIFKYVHFFKVEILRYPDTDMPYPHLIRPHRHISMPTWKLFWVPIVFQQHFGLLYMVRSNFIQCVCKSEIKNTWNRVNYPYLHPSQSSCPYRGKWGRRDLQISRFVIEGGSK